MPKSNDVTIFYFGASGGFFALYMLLLTKQYQCCFKNGDTDVFKVKESQWNVNDVSKWKYTEIWPDNVKTLTSTFTANKVFFVCNPDPIFLSQPGEFIRTYEDFPGKKILLYTDLQTQWHLAKTKRAYWFQPGRELDGSGPQWKTDEFMQEQFRYRYDNAKLPSWPECPTVEQFYSLPKDIQDKCIIDNHFWELLDYKKFDDPAYCPIGVEHNGETIYKRAADFMTGMDVIVKLQDIINTKGRALLDPLGVQSTPDTVKFVIQYLSLHTPDQRMHLTKKS